MIATLVNTLCAKIVEEVNTGLFFTLMVDGTNDKNGCEIISIVVQYVLDDKPKEILVGLENCDNLSAEATADISKIICQCYDGTMAAIMNRAKGGVQKIIHVARFIDTRLTGHLKHTVSTYKNYEEIVATLSSLQTTANTGEENQRPKCRRFSVSLWSMHSMQYGILRAISTHKFPFNICFCG